MPNMTCINCEHYSWDLLEDSFGPYALEYCEKDQYPHVGMWKEPCEHFKERQTSGEDKQ